MDANAWMGVVALAPAAVVLGLETGALAASARLCNCFVEGTEVQTPDGFKMIEDVEVGDLVLARDEDTGESAYKPVVALIAGSEREIWEVTIETTDGQNVVRQEPIRTTVEHPWRTADGRWIETKDLAPGMELVSSNGDRAVVISAFKTDRVEPTYNFEVEGLHTYFVGEAGVWVHNACPLLEQVSNLRAVEIIARGGGIRTVRQLVQRYGGRTDQWRKMKGVGDVNGRAAESHWYQNDSSDRFLGKIKYWF